MNFAKDYSNYDTLVASLHERDIEAFNYVYVTLRKKLFVLALYIVESEENAKDLVQDLFVEFWENRLYQKITVSIEYYLLKAIKNNAINFKRKQMHFLSLKKDLLPPAYENGYTRVENYELGKELNAAIEQLSPMSSKVFQLHYINRLSYKEISLKLGISQSTISTHMDRALKKLRSSLQKEE